MGHKPNQQHHGTEGQWFVCIQTCTKLASSTTVYMILPKSLLDIKHDVTYYLINRIFNNNSVCACAALGCLKI